MIAQFTAKTRNLEKAIYFLSLMSCSIKLKSHILFTCKNFTKNFCFPIYRGKDSFGPGNGGGAGAKVSPSFDSLTIRKSVIFLYHI